jgi:hypothetical protein
MVFDYLPAFDDTFRMVSKWNKYDLRDELDLISKTSLSEELKLVVEFLLLFQWVEHQAKELLWFLYGATSEKRANIYLTNKKTEAIKQLNIEPLCRELECFHIDEDGYREMLSSTAKKLRSISKARNNITHHLFAREIEDKVGLSKKLKLAIQNLKELEKDIEKISIPINSIAADVEIKSKMKQYNQARLQNGKIN